MRRRMLSLARIGIQAAFGLTGIPGWEGAWPGEDMPGQTGSREDTDSIAATADVADAVEKGVGTEHPMQKGSRGKLLVYLALHYFDLDAAGFSQTGSVGEIAKATGLSRDAVRMSIRCLSQERLVHAGGFLRDGGFTFHIAGYEKIGRRASGNGRDYFNLELAELKVLASMQDTNAVRFAMWLLSGLDDPRNDGQAQIPMAALRRFMPKRMTKAALMRMVFSVREAFPALELELSEDAVCATATEPEKESHVKLLLGNRKGEIMSRIICAECGAVDKYEFRDSTREYEGDGYHFTLPVRVPFCTRCGAPVAMEEIEEPISREANRRIRECRGIIQTEEIQQILHDYQVTPEALSRLLGWDEAAVARYVEKGYTPSVENSNTLKALKDPKVFRALAQASQSDTEKTV